VVQQKTAKGKAPDDRHVEHKQTEKRGEKCGEKWTATYGRLPSFIHRKGNRFGKSEDPRPSDRQLSGGGKALLIVTDGYEETRVGKFE